MSVARSSVRPRVRWLRAACLPACLLLPVVGRWVARSLARLAVRLGLTAAAGSRCWFEAAAAAAAASVEAAAAAGRLAKEEKKELLLLLLRLALPLPADWRAGRLLVRGKEGELVEVGRSVGRFEGWCQRTFGRREEHAHAHTECSTPARGYCYYCCCCCCYSASAAWQFSFETSPSWTSTSLLTVVVMVLVGLTASFSVAPSPCHCHLRR